MCRTAVVSLWAYLWMLIVYQFWTPDRVTMVEAFLTLSFMPVLIIIAYFLDAKPWQKVVEAEDHTDPQLYQVYSSHYACFDIPLLHQCDSVIPLPRLMPLL